MNGQGGLDSSEFPIEYEKVSDFENLPELEYSAYRIKKGDMIGVIALNHQISEDTLISVNNIKATRYVQAGDYIRIPSMSGILYTVRKDGETINSISNKYEIDPAKCSKVNSYNQSKALSAGTQLFLPDAKLDWVTRQEINGDLFTRPIHHGRYYFSSNWGWRNNPFSGKRTFHGGIDMACAIGTPIYSALGGTVIRTGYNEVYGNFVEIVHHSGYKTLYGHMSRITCSRGQYVTTNTKIGEVGSTGISTGPHLHFGIYKNGKSQNPRLLWK
ncbi:MAG: peptidoglycan DD-metalloendopeptidase family protein [Treponemataceae bacterium]